MPDLNPYLKVKLAYLILLLSFMFFFCVVFVPIPETGEDNAKYIIGFLVGTGLVTIIQFYFRRPGAPDLPETEQKDIKVP